MIVKVTLGVKLLSGSRTVRIRDEMLSINIQKTADQRLLEKMDKRLTAYFNASDTNGFIEILDEVSPQTW